MEKTIIDLVIERESVSASQPLPADILLLVQTAIDRTMTEEQAALAAVGDADALALIGRAIATEEGRLLEEVVATLAARKQSSVVLRGMRLPVSDSAIDLIERNGHVAATVALDPDAKARRTYFPDLVIADRREGRALVIDVKRSISGYLGSSKLSELRVRMQAGGMSLPELLWRDHQRLAVQEVGIAIIDGSADKSDVDAGIWCLGDLEALLGVTDAGAFSRTALDALRRGVRKRWMRALDRRRDEMPVQTASLVKADASATDPGVNSLVPKRGRGRPRKATVQPVAVGIYRPPVSKIH